MSTRSGAKTAAETGLLTADDLLRLDSKGVPGYAEVVPDLVVEFAEPVDSRRALHDKALMWLRYGTRLVWVEHPESRTVDVHRTDDKPCTLSDGDALDGLDVLPGFTCPVRAIFEAPRRPAAT